jgi:hypothetical protein
MLSRLVVVEGGLHRFPANRHQVRPFKNAAIRITGRSAVGGRVVRKLPCDENGRSGLTCQLVDARYCKDLSVGDSAA